MRRVLWVPQGTEKKPEIIDLDAKQWPRLFPQIDVMDPYQAFRMLCATADGHTDLDRVVFGEKVNTPWYDTKLFVDDEGLWKGRPENRVSHIMYPGKIIGDIMVCKVHIAGPEMNIVDREWEDIVSSLLMVTSTPTPDGS